MQNSLTPYSSVKNDVNFNEVNQDKLTEVPMLSLDKPESNKDQDLKMKSDSFPTKDTVDIKNTI